MFILCVGMIGYGIIEGTGKVKKVSKDQKSDFELVGNSMEKFDKS